MSQSYEILHACPACGGRSLAVVADRTNVQHQVEALWSFHTRRVQGDTPPRRLVDRSAFSQRPPLAIVACTGCGTLLRNRLVNVAAPLRAPAWAVLAWNNLLGFPYRHGFTAAAIEMLFARERLRSMHVHGDALVRISDAYTRRWARLEEAALKTVLRHTLPRDAAPWIEVYAR